MILNVSGRTDIVAFYSEWFMNRLKEGYVDVRNPYYRKQISRIYFKNVDAIVFCTKNPIPLLKYIDKINIPFIVHITITPYNKEIEPNVPSKVDLINAIKKLSELIGKEKIYIRYDPIFLSDKYNTAYHIKAFEKLTSHLDGATDSIIVSFIDYYKNVKNNIKTLKLSEITTSDYKQIGIKFSKIAKKHNITVQTCAEENNLIEYGFIRKDCIDKKLAKELTQKEKFKEWKSRKNENCKCVEMVDIGHYNTCLHFCKYCYANYDEKKVRFNNKKHNPNSSLLIGKIEENDIIKERKK